MADDPKNQPGEAKPGQPAGEAQPAAVAEQSGKDKDEYLVLRNRAIEAERKVAKLEETQKKASEARLSEDGKHQELAKLKEAEANDWKQRYVQAQRNSALIAAGAKAGVNDPSDLVLAKLGEVDVGDEAALRDAAEKAVGDLSKSKPYLFGKTTKNGTPFNTPLGNPGGSEVKVPKVSAEEVANLSREQKQAIVDNHFKGGAGGGFFRK